MAKEDKLESAGAMPKAYDPCAVEERLYRMWEERGYFAPRDGADGEPFTIIMPPPNLTGELHLGHALMDTVEDILIRWHRMRGEPTLWLPGIDHAAIAVHTMVERELAQEGLTRHDIGRERFLERVWAFVNASRARIFDQHKRLGASADWSRERFTMDPGPARAVRTAFYELYRHGLIYRGERLINWCPRCSTALSDLEVNHEEQQGHLWHVRYPLLDHQGRTTDDPSGASGQGFITIATTRPETIVADTGVAVHPEDERYRSLVGRRARLPIIGRELPIVADEAIDPEFGTGALKVTPGHDQVDFEIGQRHGLPIVNAIAPDGTMNAEAGPYQGMDRFACREAIVRDLEEQGFLAKTEPYQHSIGHCERCATIVEPLISEQWFVAVNKEYLPGRSIAGEALRVVNDGLIRFVPQRFTRDYTNWMENIRDWCISRQLWWGHRIPVWYCQDCPSSGRTAIVPPPEVEEPDRCEECGGASLRQDEDTLDTWFSSALWPCSTLGWPDDTEDLRRFYPTAVMETGYEIIFFWVARMIMMGLFCMEGLRDDVSKRIPFRYVYLHGMVRDEHGQKMSKTKGNVVDPIVLVEKYGADALRFNLITAGGTGQDQRLWEEKVEAARNFANKLWNAARFVIMKLDAGTKVEPPSLAERERLPAEDRWILSRLDHLVADVDQLLRDFQLNEAGHRMYDFLWSEYCDWYVEMAKVRLREQGTGNKEQGWSDPQPVLVHVLETGLRLLHPYMPFLTEELWQRLRPYLAEVPYEALIVAPYPRSEPAWQDAEAERQVEGVIDVVRAIRNIRSEKRVEPARYIEAYVVANDSAAGSGQGTRSAIEAGAPYIEALARVRPLHIVSQASEAPREGVATAVLPHAQAVVPLAELMDAEAERARLCKEMEEVETYLQRIEAKLSNEQFRARAPREIVAAEEERRAAAQTRLEGLRRALEELG
ncbi:MAG: valine--tRNA ligase [Chloroflexi bacterium RBG_16_68_14]|nr:MAG: valine--tRNA ligase [Chloroflexi bacterium RBG_16_68_14]